MKIYWLSDSPCLPTGYSTISTHILNGLSDLGHKCIYQAHNYLGQTIPPGLTFEDGSKLKFTVMGTGKEPYSQDMLIPRIRQLKPDIFGVLLDTFMLYPWALNLDYAPAKSLFYYPSDGEAGLPLRCETILRKFNIPVAMSKFAQKQTKDCYGIDVDYIPHAIDTKNYFPLPQKQKEELRINWGFQDKFVVGSVYRNQGRKMSDRMFKAFSIFAKTHPDAILFLHSDPYDQAATFDSIELIKNLKIENRVVWSGMNFFNGFTLKQMNEIYNLMDVFFLSTSGEGFGVPTIEASACKIPTIVTDFTTTQELLVDYKQCGIPVPIVTDITGSWNVERGVMDINKAVEALEIMYNDSKLRRLYGEHGRDKVEKLYSWDVVIPQWQELLMRKLE